MNLTNLKNMMSTWMLNIAIHLFGSRYVWVVKEGGYVEYQGIVLKGKAYNVTSADIKDLAHTKQPFEIVSTK